MKEIVDITFNRIKAYVKIIAMQNVGTHIDNLSIPIGYVYTSFSSPLEVYRDCKVWIPIDKKTKNPIPHSMIISTIFGYKILMVKSIDFFESQPEAKSRYFEYTTFNSFKNKQYTDLPEAKYDLTQLLTNY